ncbi:Caffeoylshikimate esterase [Linum perenne]
MVHGYSNDCSWTFQSTAIFIAKNGFACFSLDIEGHSRSQGLKAYVPNIDLVVHDCSSYFESVKRDPMFVGIRSFLYGESMGGAMCLLIHFANPNSFLCSMWSLMSYCNLYMWPL